MLLVSCFYQIHTHNLCISLDADLSMLMQFLKVNVCSEPGFCGQCIASILGETYTNIMKATIDKNISVSDIDLVEILILCKADVT